MPTGEARQGRLAEAAAPRHAQERARTWPGPQAVEGSAAAPGSPPPWQSCQEAGEAVG